MTLCTLSILRFFVVFLSFLLLCKLCRLSRWDIVEDENSLSWSSINAQGLSSLPNPLNLLILHELLAHPQIECAKTLHGDIPFDFFLCSPPNFSNNSSFSSSLFISASSISKRDFQASLSIPKWTLFIPESDDSVDRLNGEVDVHYLVDLPKWNEWKIEEIVKTVKDKEFSLLILNLYSGHLRPSQKLIEEIVQSICTSSILLHLRVSSSQDAQSWHSLLLSLFFNYNYSLVGTTSSGICGPSPFSCEYRISLVKIHPFLNTFQPPPFNLGSPLEETNRLYRFLSLHSIPCSFVHLHSLPHFCQEGVSHNTRTLLLTYSQPQFSPQHIFPLNSTQLSVVSPYKSPLTSLHYGISLNGLSESADEEWSLLPIDEIFNRVSSPSLLLVDLNGGEWTLIESIVDYVIEKTIKQVAFSIRFFIQEDSSIRQFLASSLRLSAAGYGSTTISHNNSHLSLVFRLESTVPTL